MSRTAHVWALAIALLAANAPDAAVAREDAPAVVAAEAEARAAEQSEDWLAAAAAWKSAHAAAPSAARAESAARCLLAFAEAALAAEEPGSAIRGAFEDARRAIERAKQAGATSLSLDLGMARCLAAEGRESDGIRILEQSISANPRDTAPRRALAFALWNAGRPAEAIPHLRALSDAAPDDDRLALTLSRAARDSGDVALAATAAERRIAAAPADRRGWEALWSAYSKEKRWGELAARVVGHASKDGSGALAAHYAGFACAASGAVDDALRWLARAAELDPANDAARVERARLLLQARRDRDGASEILRGILAKRPATQSAVDLLSFLAMRRSEDGDHDGAAREAEALTAARPDDPVVRANLALELRWAGRYEAAEVAYRKALELSPKDPVIWNDYGLMLLAVRRRKDAIRAFERGREADPSWNDNIENLAWYARSQDRYADALPLFRDAYASALRKGTDGSRHRRNMDDARFPLPPVR